VNLASRIMADARSGKPCIRCGSTGTVYGRHYNGLRQHQYGKGRAIKCHPFAVADFCRECDLIFQEGSVAKSDINGRSQYSEEFLHYCLLSLIRREKEGFFDG
jgi:hypothetical protein